LSHVADSLHMWRDTLTLGHVSNWNGINDKTNGNDQLMQTVET
jgi:hypothetical protein